MTTKITIPLIPIIIIIPEILQHLNHGFQSSFQSLGANHRKYTPLIKKIGSIYSAVIAAGFSMIAIYHFIF